MEDKDNEKLADETEDVDKVQENEAEKKEKKGNKKDKSDLEEKFVEFVERPLLTKVDVYTQYETPSDDWVPPDVCHEEVWTNLQKMSKKKKKVKTDEAANQTDVKDWEHDDVQETDNGNSQLHPAEEPKIEEELPVAEPETKKLGDDFSDFEAEPKPETPPVIPVVVVDPPAREKRKKKKRAEIPIPPVVEPEPDILVEEKKPGTPPYSKDLAKQKLAELVEKRRQEQQAYSQSKPVTEPAHIENTNLPKIVHREEEKNHEVQKQARSSSRQRKKKRNLGRNLVDHEQKKPTAEVSDHSKSHSQSEHHVGRNVVQKSKRSGSLPPISSNPSSRTSSKNSNFSNSTNNLYKVYPFDEPKPQYTIENRPPWQTWTTKASYFIDPKFYI